MIAPIRLYMLAALALCAHIAAASTIRSQPGVTPRPDPGASPFPDSSICDFSFLLDAPAGKHGFLSVGSDGQFRWPTGKRARFWGVNISNRSVFVPQHVIGNVVDVLARSGANMVRFEALDSADGLLHSRDGTPLRGPDAGKLDALDYWTNRLRTVGIYYYFDLLDLRTFVEADGVPEADRLGRAGRPYAMFDPTLIEVQKRYARDLLTHRNPYTGLRYVDDPALALVEICNESGFFLRPEALEAMPPRMHALLRSRWNEWLIGVYGTRSELERAWSLPDGHSALGDDEDPVAGTVSTPVLSASPDRGTGVSSDPRYAPQRYADGVRFLMQVQSDYFREMLAFLRSVGLRSPVTGVTSTQYVGDAASGQGLDFAAGNYYCDHPTFSGADWGGDLFYRDVNPLRETASFRSAPWMAALRWGRRPVVIREWAQPWPNRYRCVAAAEMAGYGGLQDLDGFLLFGYQVAPRPDRLGDFDHQADPPVWGLFGPAALSFLRGDIRPAPVGVSLGYGPADAYAPPGTIGQAIRVAWHTRVRSDLAISGAQPDRRSSFSPAAPPSDIIRELRRRGLSGGSVDGGTLTSAGGEIRRITRLGVVSINTPRTVVVSGEIGARTWAVGPLRLYTRSPIGTLWVVSLDGLPLTRSTRYLAKMVTGAWNTSQRTERADTGSPAPYRVVSSGTAPVRTGASAKPGGLRLVLNGRLIVSLELVGGVWELLRDGSRAVLYCDTPNTAARVYGAAVAIPRNGRVVVEIPKDRSPRAQKPVRKIK